MNIPPRILQQAKEKMLVDRTVQMCFLISVLVLNGKDGYGKKRLTDYSEEFAQTFIDYRDRYGEVALEALTKHAKEKGIEVDWV